MELQTQLSCVLLPYSPSDIFFFLKRFIFHFFCSSVFSLTSILSCFVISGFSGSVKKSLSYSPTYLFFCDILAALCWISLCKWSTICLMQAFLIIPHCLGGNIEWSIEVFLNNEHLIGKRDFFYEYWALSR